MVKRVAASARAVIRDHMLPTDRGSWWRHWELWLAVVLGAFLRLWHVDMSTFGDDQTQLATIARQAVVRHVLPVSGMPFSVHALSPPLSIYLLMPFFTLGADPLPAVLATAIWNVAGVALCYVFVLRSFGRRIAALATLLFATCGAAVAFSRFIWQTNMMPPLTILWALTLFAGCVHGWRAWLAPNVALLALVAQLHPTALLLAPVTLVGVLLAPHWPRGRDIGMAVGALALILAPTIVWEVMSHGSDVTLLLHYGGGPSTLDPNVVFRLYQVLGGPLAAAPAFRPGHGIGALVALLVRTPLTTDFLPGVPYAALGDLPLLISLAAFALYVLGWTTLTLRVLAPAVVAWRQAPPSTRRQRLVPWLRKVWEGLRGDAAWRAYLLLWLWATVPPLLMLRHSGGIYPHYVVALYPALFVVMALPAQLWTDRAWLRAFQSERQASAGLRIPVSSVVASRLPGVALAALIVCMAAQSGLFVASLASGRVNPAADHYGIPLEEMRAASSRIGELQRQTGAALTVVESSSALDPRLTYLLVSEHTDRLGADDHCLVLPDTTTKPALVVVTSPQSPAAQLLAGMPNAVHSANIAMPGGAPFGVYQVRGAAPALGDETAVAPVLFLSQTGMALRLDAVAASPGSTMLRLRWRVLAAGTAEQAAETLRIGLWSLSGGASVGGSIGYHDCAPTSWQPGETIFTWIAAPQPATPGQPPQQLILQIQGFQRSLMTMRAGPWTLLTGNDDETPSIAFSTSALAPPASSRALGTIAPGGLALTAADLSSLGRDRASG